MLAQLFRSSSAALEYHLGNHLLVDVPGEYFRQWTRQSNLN